MSNRKQSSTFSPLGNRAGAEVLLADLEVEANRLVEALRGLA